MGDSPLETLRVQEAGALLSAGSADGQITLLELSDSLVNSGKNDRLVLTAVRLPPPSPTPSRVLLDLRIRGPYKGRNLVRCLEEG